MKLVMISCARYSDAWRPFFSLLNKFWPDHLPVTMIMDFAPSEAFYPDDVGIFVAGDGLSWCEVLKEFSSEQGEPFLLLQEDFFLTANVRTELIAAAAAQLGPNIGGIRLYPCPGGATPLSADARIGIAGESYKVSCQATIWDPAFLVELLTEIGPGSAAHFEIEGSKRCHKTMLAWMRECKPWPIEYLCSGISRGSWTQDAKKLCDANGIEVDWSRRPMQVEVTA